MCLHLGTFLFICLFTYACTYTHNHSSIHEFKCSRDRVLLRYRRLGNGKKVILLCNGVGTGFFMWLPILQELIKLNKNIW